MNETNNQPSNAQTAGNQVSALLGKILKSGCLRDFIAFKIMIFPKIVIVLNFIAMLSSILYGFVMLFQGEIFSGLLSIVFGPFIVHILFELLMLPYAILDLLRDIRNKTA